VRPPVKNAVKAQIRAGSRKNPSNTQRTLVLSHVLPGFDQETGNFHRSRVKSRREGANLAEERLAARDPERMKIARPA